MKIARQKFSPRYLVDASDASHSESYICPVCQAPVFLRAGVAHDPHFAHKKGTGRPDCELYFSSTTHAHDFTNDQHALLGQPWEIAIGLQLATVGFPRGWGIELSVPTRGCDRGSILIDVGGRQQLINLTGNIGTARRLVAEPQSQPYRVISIEPHNSVLFERLSRSCTGLKTREATVFGDVVRPGSQLLPRASELRVEHTYAFIWHQSAKPVFPEEFHIEMLSQRAEWNGALVTIPSQLSKASKIWVESFSGVALAEETPTFVPVWPPYVHAVTARYFESAERTPLVFSLTGALRREYSESPSVFSRSGTEVMGVNLLLEEPHFFQLFSDEEKELQVISRSMQDARIEIGFKPAPSSHFFASVQMIGGGQNGSLCKVYLHSMESSEWLSQARNKTITPVSIDFPPGCQGKIYAGRNGVWKLVALLTKDGQEAAELLVKALDNPTTDIRIDFGALGTATSAAPQATSDDCKYVIATRTRKRLLAYLMQFDTRPTWPRLAKRFSDESLIKAFLSSTPRDAMKSLHIVLMKEIGILKNSDKARVI